MGKDDYGSMLGFAIVATIFALTIFGIVSDFRLARATDIEPLRCFSYLLGATSCLMFTHLFFACISKETRGNYIIGLTLITIWCGFATGVVGTTRSIADLPADFCRLAGSSSPAAWRICADIKTVRWNAWFVLALGTIAALCALQKRFVVYLLVGGVPLTVAVFQLVQAVYAEGIGYITVSWLLGVSTSLMLLCFVGSLFCFRPTVSFINLNIGAQFYIWLVMTSGLVGSTTLFLQRSTADCRTYICRARLPVLVLSWIVWSILLVAFSALLATRRSPKLQVWISTNGKWTGFPILPELIVHAAPPIIFAIGIVFQLAIARDEFISSSMLRQLAIFLTACSGASLALTMFVTTVQSKMIPYITRMWIWWYPLIILPVLGIPGFMTYSAIAYTIEYTKQSSDRCVKRDIPYSAASYCRWQMVALVFSWILWLFCFSSALYIASCVFSDLRSRWLAHAAERRRWEDFRANAPPMGGHIQDISTDSAATIVAALPAGGQGKENIQPAGGAGGNIPVPQWIVLTSLFNGFRRDKETA